MQKITVLSLFDGIACGRIALERANIPVGRYIASEIEQTAIKAAVTNYPDIEEIGDVRNIDPEKLPPIDLLIGGSPCQGFSSSGKGLNFSDPRSRLFFEYVRIMKAVKPKYFLLENVKMKSEWRDIITSYMGVEPILINSNLVSAQNRDRLYWTNIPGVCLPEDRGIHLQDILESEEWDNPGAIRGRQLNKGCITGRRLNSKGHRADYDKTVPITQCLEVRASNTDKSNCLTTVAKDNVLTPLLPGRYPDVFGKKLPFRYYTRTECCRLQTVPEHYLDCISESAALKALGNGWTVDVIAHILSFIKQNEDK